MADVDARLTANPNDFGALTMRGSLLASAGRKVGLAPNADGDFIQALARLAIFHRSGFFGGGRRRQSKHLYVGFDVRPVADAIKTGNPANIVPAVTAAWEMLQNNNFAERAEALAAEIEETQPLLVGLQEVANIFFNQEAQPRLDYLKLLIDALESRGLHYQAVAELSEQGEGSCFAKKGRGMFAANA